MAFPKIGNLALAFSLKNQDGKTVSLKDFKGKSTVVLYFYPAAMTPGCTVQACGLRDTAIGQGHPWCPAREDAVGVGRRMPVPDQETHRHGRQA